MSGPASIIGGRIKAEDRELPGAAESDRGRDTVGKGRRTRQESRGEKAAYYSGNGLKTLPEYQRPRERLLAYGPDRLSEAELLAILLGSGSRGESALALAQRLLSAEGGAFLVEADARELERLKGIGVAKACRIKAAIELASRLSGPNPSARPTIKGPRDAAEIARAEIGSLTQEAVRVICLNTANQVIAIDSVSLGGLSSAPVHPREIFKGAIKRSAAGIILAHNHPSGQVKPSRGDREETRRLKQAGELLGLRLYDHIIVGGGRYYSFLEEGELA